MSHDDYDKLKRRVIEKIASDMQNEDSSLVFTARVNEIGSFVENSVHHRLLNTINTYEDYMRSYMPSDRVKLDGHKLASCICGAICDVKPLQQDTTATGRKLRFPNEALALFSALKYLRPFIITHFLDKYPMYKNMRNRILTDFNVSFPEELICDKRSYVDNLLAALHRSKAYDVFAYAKIFYHIDLYNINKLKLCCELWSQE